MSMNLTESILACTAALRSGDPCNLEEMVSGLQEVRQSLAELDDVAQELADSDETDLLRRGLIAWLEGVEALEAWLEERDPQLLDRSEALTVEGDCCMAALAFRAA